MTKKIFLGIAIALFTFYFVDCSVQEIIIDQYCKDVAAYVDGARKNGIITEKSCENLKRHLHYGWSTPFWAKKIQADHVRDCVNAAYQKQEKRESRLTLDYVLSKMQ